MRHAQLRCFLGVGALSLGCALGGRLHAGGRGLNTIVVINQASSNSCELANYFCERRGVPPENVLRINWPGANTSWSGSDFQTVLLNPLLDMLVNRQLTNQAEYVVLSMDIPFQTVNGSTVNGTTSALFYGLRSNSGDSGVTNSYAASEAMFSEAKPASAPGCSFLATMITADSLAEAKQLVDQGVASDGTFPNQSAILAKSSDPARNMRYVAFDNAVFNVRVRGVSSILRTNTDSLWNGTNFLGYQTGLADFTVPVGAFVPGAMADSLTSHGGVIFGMNSQTSLLAMIRAGASGSYGTVAEPGTDAQKFPDPQVFFYQSRGFGLAESYYQSLNAPYLGLIVAEPLASPFAQAGSGSLVCTNAILSGTVKLSTRFSASDKLTLQQIDLFLDGKYLKTLTNLAPRAGNVLNLAFNGYRITYTVPPHATLGLVATGLAAVVNAPAVTNITKIVAYPHGDRIELHSLSTNQWAESFYFTDTAANSTNRSYRVNYLPENAPPQLTPAGFDRNGKFGLHVDIATTLPYVIQASTNLTDWQPVFTNSAGGLLDFTDADAAGYSNRFYRVVEPVPDPQAKLSVSAVTNGSSLSLHIETTSALPYAVQVSTNLGEWTSLFTNQVGGAMDFVDALAPSTAGRFYRTCIIPQTPPTFAVLDGPAGNAVVRVDHPVRPFVVEVSTNQHQWVGLVTNYVVGQVQTDAGSSVGSADGLTTFLRASRSTFLNSEAYGRQQYLVVNSSLSVGAYLQFAFTKTNGTVVTVGLTNQTAGQSSTNFARQFYDLLNATVALQGADGAVAEDFDVAASVFFNVRPRTPGWPAAAIRVGSKSAGVNIFPTATNTLTQNLSDLRPRNHLYVTAGASQLSLSFSLDTTGLADGHHELTAVAYEGSHVRTQTKATLPVIIQNTFLSANLTLLDLPDTAPVQGSYRIRVTAITTNDIRTIALCSTGGVLDTVSNQSTAIFQVEGVRLGVGLHPFYALVQDSSGSSYRTETKQVRLINGP